jgi:hypothetical protein
MAPNDGPRWLDHRPAARHRSERGQRPRVLGRACVHEDNTIDHAALEGLRWLTAYLFERLEMYRQFVFEFGWGAYKQVFASHYSPAYSDELDGLYLDGFAIRFSRIVGRDLTAFFDHWEYPLSDPARARISSLGLTEWLPPGW